MICSMTGFGRGKAENDNIIVTVDVKSVNHRYLETFIKLPRNYVVAEESVRAIIKEALKRGKVEMFVNIEVKEAEKASVKLNLPLAKAYKEALATMQHELGLEYNVSPSSIIRFPDIILPCGESEENEEENTNCIKEATKDALKALVSMRKAEGEKLAADIRKRGALLKEKLELVKKESESLPAEYAQRLRARLEELLGDAQIPEERTAQEIAIFADKANVTEEIVRLASHLAQLDTILLEGAESVGKKLDFLVQEMNREANTIASKANKLEVTQISLDMKCEIEKIREQVQNLE